MSCGNRGASSAAGARRRGSLAARPAIGRPEDRPHLPCLAPPVHATRRRAAVDGGSEVPGAPAGRDRQARRHRRAPLWRQARPELFYGRPTPGNLKAAEHFARNRFSVTRQPRYSRHQTANALDLGLFINGLPIATFDARRRGSLAARPAIGRPEDRPPLPCLAPPVHATRRRAAVNGGSEPDHGPPENFWYFNNGITIVCD